MLEDIQRTFAKCFGWVFTILHTGLIFFAIAASVACLFLFFGFRTLGVICALVAVFCAFFFRDPKRNTVFADDEIACPADGTVLSVKTEEDPNSIVVRIFLSIFDVHVQRATVTGKIGQIFYHPGTFLFADNPASNKNERNLIQILKNGDPTKFAHVEQITGAIARRIECWVKPDQEIKAGEHVGMIRFGSQVAVYLPKDSVRVLVKEGQKVQGALTVLALWK